MKLLKYITLLLSFTLVFSSCKYEEGPSLSLRTKTSRITGKWNVEKITEHDGNTFTPNANNSIVYTFNKSGDGEYDLKFLGIDSNQSLTWEFKNSKEDIKIIYNNGDVAYGRILRLTNEEMVVFTTDDDRWELEKQ